MFNIDSVEKSVVTIFIGRGTAMYKWETKENNIIIYDLKDFDPVHIFECGQCFRWNLLENGHWLGVVQNLVLDLEWDDKNLILYNTSEREFFDIWFTYFDFGRDYGAIKESLASKDPIMAEAVKFGQGIRLLKQDFNETMISFIISQNNGIPRIKKIIESLATNFGDPINSSHGVFYSFPDLEKLSRLELNDLKVIKAGYRDKYILRAAQQVINKEIDMSSIFNRDTQEARKEMLKLYGVGEKVADCILLFSGTKYDIFPVDRWVKRVMAELYLGYEASYQELYEFAIEKFGDLAGFAQQYLFYYAREKKIGM